MQFSSEGTMDSELRTLEFVADVIDLGAACLLVIGLVWAFVSSLRDLMAEQDVKDKVVYVIEKVRYRLSQALLLSLEVLIVSEIFHTIVHRTIEETAILAAIVTIRIALSFFLIREVENREA